MDRTLGIELVEANGKAARGRFRVTDSVRQPSGIVHGGAYASCAEMVATAATEHALDRRFSAMGLANHTSFLRPVFEGVVEASALAVHTGKTTWVWEVTMVDSGQRTCAVSRVTVAIRAQAT